jgi:2Fe-2S ferredoxin
LPRITFIASDGQRVDVDGRVGESVMLAALVGMVSGIEAECGGACSCGTCHVYVDDAWRDVVGPPGELEAGMLEMIEAVTGASRLCCQIRISDEIDGMVVRTPA